MFGQAKIHKIMSKLLRFKTENERIWRKLSVPSSNAFTKRDVFYTIGCIKSDLRSKLDYPEKIRIPKSETRDQIIHWILPLSRKILVNRICIWISNGTNREPWKRRRKRKKNCRNTECDWTKCRNEWRSGALGSMEWRISCLRKATEGDWWRK